MGKNLIAVAILIVLGVIALFVFRDRPSSEKEKAASAIASYSVDEVNEIRILRTEGTGEAAAKEHIVLVKTEDTWKMVEPMAYPVETTPVEYMAETLGKLNVIDIISDNKSKHALFGVDEKLGVEMMARQRDKQLLRIIVGKSSGNFTYVRLPESDEVYRVLGSHRRDFDKSATSLRDKTVLDLKVGDIGKVTFFGKHGELVLARAEGKAGTKLQPVGVQIQNFNDSKAEGILRTFGRVRAREFVDSALPIEQSGLGDNAYKIVIELTGSGEPETITLWLGADKEENKVTYLKTSTSDQLFLIMTAIADRIRVAADDFARTDDDLAKDEEQKKKARANAMPGTAMPPGMGGMPSGQQQQIPPELMKQIREQMARQQGAPSK
jgi:hypothetical protein